MAGTKFLCDTGPLAGFFNRPDQYHSWAAAQFDQIFQPLLTCEAVISEMVFLLQDDGLSCEPLFEAIDRGKLIVAFSAKDHWADLRRLINYALSRFRTFRQPMATPCISCQGPCQ